MKSMSAERGMVKLIHPGRQVEILKEPITVAEVMSKNPRHVITRPDVFTNPWIVMKPESVLPTGRVFLIVPNRTVYDLMKDADRKHHHRHSSPIRHRQISKNRDHVSDHHWPPKSNPPPKQFAGNTPKDQPNCSHRDRGKRVIEPEGSRVEEAWPWPTMRKNVHEEFRELMEMEENSTTESMITDRVEESMDETLENVNRDQKSGEVDAGLVASSSMSGGPVSGLKSCLRKPDSVRRSLDLRVSFVLTLEERQNQNRTSTQTHRRRFVDFLNLGHMLMQKTDHEPFFAKKERKKKGQSH